MIIEKELDMPDRWEYCIHSTYYKIGRHNFTFMWNNGHWQRSTKSEYDLKYYKNKTNINNVGNPAGNRAKAGPTNQKLVLEAVTVMGAMNKHQLIAETGLSDDAVKHALSSLKGSGDLSHNTKTNIYSLPTDPQLELSWRAIA